MNAYLIAVLVSFVIYLVVAFVVNKYVKDANDYFVAGRNAPVGLIVGSMTASLLSTGLFLGDSGEAYNGMWIATAGCAAISAGGYILGAVFFSRHLRRTNVYTIPSFFEKRFQSRAVGIMAVIAVVVAMAVYLLSVTQGGATLMSNVTGLDYKICIILAVALFTIMVVSSGSKGVLITDTIMFGLFTTIGTIAVLIVAHKAGGWFNVIQEIGADPDKSYLLSWHGKLGYWYETGLENVIWFLSYGVCWAGVSICGPWQCSRNLMAKNEHTVIRSSVWVIIGCFAINAFVQLGAVFINAFDIGDTEPTQVWLWASKSLLPSVIGVVLVTGIIAAAISSATTFLSLVGASISNDILRIEDGKKNVMVSRISMIILAVVVAVVAIINPPNIWWIMQIGATVVICAMLPVALASVWWKNITKAGAFWGMLVGFAVSFLMKVMTTFYGVSVPIYLDVYFVGTISSILAMVIASKLTKVTPEEEAERAALFVVPEEENDPVEIEKTRRSIKMSMVIGVGIFVVCVVFWIIPYYMGKGII